MLAHEEILKELLGKLPGNDIIKILDAGSGRTSLSIIYDTFPESEIDCVVFPGDERKIASIRECLPDRRYNLLELDLCIDIPELHYDLTVSHLLLGEAAKFNNSFSELLTGLLSLQSDYLIIIDYYEDPEVDLNEIKTAAINNKYKIISESFVKNDKPQVWDKFAGIHNFGILLKKHGSLESGHVITGMKDQLDLIAKSYDKGIEYGRQGISLYENLPEYITNNPDYIIYNKNIESVTNLLYSGHNEIREYLAPVSAMKFIDLGCCLNLVLHGYDKWPSSYYGIDISRKTIELLNELSLSNKIQVGGLVCGSIHETPFDADFFDIGTCIGVLEYYTKDFIEEILIEAHRILKPYGKLVIDVPNIASPACRGMMLLEENAGRPDRFDMLPLDFEHMLCKYFVIEKAEKADTWAMFQYFLSCKNE